MTRRGWRSTAIRWLKFNLVGGIGIAVQLLALVCAEDRAAAQLSDRHGAGGRDRRHPQFPLA